MPTVAKEPSIIITETSAKIFATFGDGPFRGVGGVLGDEAVDGVTCSSDIVTP
jgi:hypothetical protein